MANEEHVALLKEGVETWNKWREQNPNTVPDLSEADLQGLYLIGVDFSYANLSDVNLNNAQLSDAHLNLTTVIEADLQGADLSRTNLHGASLLGADLSYTTLDRTDLSYADLREASLLNAQLSYTDLLRANFQGTQLGGAKWTGNICSYTTFGDVDLSQVKGLETVEHSGPSYIDIQTIYRSGGNIPEVFLRGAGVPDNFITFMKSLTTAAFDFYSCFISHSSKDREFVERLYADLQSSGVRCWYAPHDLIIGEPFVSGIDKGIRLHDKLLLVLSEHSVESEWMQFEVNLALTKEKGKEPWVLFPITLDDIVMKTDLQWANTIRDSRHIGDFTQWKDHDSYKKAFDKLLRDLKGKS